MLCFTHRKDTVNSCVSIIALKGNEFKAFCIIKYDRLEKPLRQRCPHSAYEHRTDSHHIRIATFHSEMWLRAPERLVPPVSDIVAVPQNISQLASLLLAGRSANFFFFFFYSSLNSKRWISANTLPTPIEMFLFTQFRSEHQQYLWINAVTFSIAKRIALRTWKRADRRGAARYPFWWEAGHY